MTKNRIFFYLFFYITLLVGFINNENSSGGAIYDFEIISKVIISFSINLRETFGDYAKFSISHFPYYYIFLSFVYKIFDNLFITKFVVLHLSLFLPIIFYKIISLKFNDTNEYLIYIPGIIFLSAYFRSAAIWALNDNIALIFFCLSIFFYYKAQNENKKHNNKILLFSFLNLISLVLAAYTRQYYAIFWIFFIYRFYILFGSRVSLLYGFISIFLSLPAVNGMFNSSNLNYSQSFYSKNLFNNTILIPSIFFVYLLPIYFNKINIKKLFFFYKNNFTFLLFNLFIVIFLIYFFDYKGAIGGGIIFKIFYYEKFPYLFYLIVYGCFLIIFHFLESNLKDNLFIFLLLITMVQLNLIYQKYLDPLSIILIFTLFKSDILDNFISNLRDNIKYFYMYFLILYLGSLYYYF